MESYDVVVVGAGNGGLTASTALAKKGLNVLLLERHNVPGGCATSFCRGRFEFEIALHQLSGLGTPEKPGPLRLLLGSLGVLDDIEFVEMDDLYNVIMPDGFEVTLKADRQQAQAELSAKFPREKDQVVKFFDLIYQYANEMLSVFVFQDPEATREKYPVLHEYALKPVSVVLDELFQDDLLKAVLSTYWGYLGLPPGRLTFAYLSLVFFTYFEFKPWHVKGGSQAMSNAILNKFLAQGGQARMGCGASRILVENGAVKAVVDESGETHTTRFVVSNASQVATYVEMIGADLVPASALRDMRGRRLSTSAFTLYVGFDCEPGDLGIAQSTNFLLQSIDFSDAILDRMRTPNVADDLMVMSCYDVADPDFSPPGTCQANIVTLKYGEPWLLIPPGKYFRHKYQAAENMLQRVEMAFPKARAHIEEIEVATPLTHMRYLGHPDGAVYGFEHYTKDSMFFQPDRSSPIQGLYFAGGWTADAGFQSTLDSGRAAAKSILKSVGG